VARGGGGGVLAGAVPAEGGGVRLRAALLLGGLALAVGLGWLVPRLTAPPERTAVAMRLLETGRAREAALLFEDPAWRGIAEHRAGRHRRAASAFLVRETPETLYNAGVAQAHVHEWAAAKAAFRKVLRLVPDHADARHNLAVVERAEAAEAEALAAARGEGSGEGPAAGRRETAPGEIEGGERLEEGAARDGETRAADAPSERGGRSEGGGLPGETQRSPDAEGGASAAAEDEEGQAPEGATAALAAIRRESAQAAAILLRRIEDDPARVLAARLRAAYALRHEREGAGR